MSMAIRADIEEDRASAELEALAFGTSVTDSERLPE
jgi:hypothetical protein